MRSWVKDGCNVFRTTLLFCLPFDTIGPSNVVSFAHEQSLFFMQIRCWKKTKTYGLVGLGAPLRQGRSLLLPTLPYQQTNRYAVVGVIPLERIWVVASYMFSLAGLSYLSRTHAPFRMARHLQVAARCFTPRSSHLFIFSPLHFCFPALPTDQPLRGSWRNST